MSTDDTRCIPIERLMADTMLPKRAVINDVRAGLLPGRMRKRQYLCTPGEYQRWLDGEFVPKPKPAPVKLLHERGTRKAS